MTATRARELRAEYRHWRGQGFDHPVAARKTAEYLGVPRSRVLGAVAGWKWWEGDLPRFYRPDPAGLGAFE